MRLAHEECFAELIEFTLARHANLKFGGRRGTLQVKRDALDWSASASERTHHG